MNHAIIAVAIFFLVTAPPVIAADEHANHQAAGHMQLSLDHGRKWATDEPLRAGMTEIRNLLSDDLEQIHQGNFPAGQYRSLGMAIQQRVNTIISQCKLDPRADAMLHIILVDLLAGADAMQGKGGMTPVTGAHRAVEAINNYGKFFNHPDWRGLP